MFVADDGAVESPGVGAASALRIETRDVCTFLGEASATRSVLLSAPLRLPLLAGAPEQHPALPCALVGLSVCVWLRPKPGRMAALVF